MFFPFLLLSLGSCIVLIFAAPRPKSKKRKWLLGINFLAMQCNFSISRFFFPELFCPQCIFDWVIIIVALPSPLDCPSFPVYGGFIVKLPQRWLSLGTVLEGLGCVRKLVKGAHHHLQCHMMVWRVIIDMQFSCSFTKPCLTLSKPMYDTIWSSIPTGHPFFFTYGLTVLSMWDVAAIFPQLVM